jgi:solute carrier family 12 sodium/potassium/chloride transporter 2
MAGKSDILMFLFDILSDAFLCQYGICILRLEAGLDYSDLLDDILDLNGKLSSDSDEDSDTLNDTFSNSMRDFNEAILKERPKRTTREKGTLRNAKRVSNRDSPANGTATTELITADETTMRRKSSFLKSTDVIKLTNTKINLGALQGLNIFYRKYQNGFVDVWWLYDDGGLSILLPYLLKQRKHWQKCKLRIFIQSRNANANVSEEQRNMANLLSKFRIEFHDLIVFSTINRKPQAATYFY